MRRLDVGTEGPHPAREPPGGHGLPDGAVSVKRGQLEGVEDTIELKFRHAAVLEHPGRGDVKKLHKLVLERLQQPD